MSTIFSIDVEDWFHMLELTSVADERGWSRMESRVERNFLRLLEILDETGVRATCFFLGWVAEHHPHLVREAARRGHEIASHGRSHRLITTQTKAEFYEDVTTTKRVLEDLAGVEVRGYRAPGFSVTPATRWAFAELARAGYRYDASVFPARRAHGSWPGAPRHPVHLADPDLHVFPMTVVTLAGARVCCFGGGYLRFFPWWVIRRMAARVEREGRPVMYYVHPREIDVAQPRLAMSAARRFKSYVNLTTTESKIRRILAGGSVSTYADFLDRNGAYFAKQWTVDRRAENGEWRVES